MCQRCHKNCSRLLCGQGKTCRMVNGFPVCVCKPHCDKTLKLRGSLCGTNGRKYGNYCALQRYNCVAEQQISVEYFGKCRKNCSRLLCGQGKTCRMVNGFPVCVCKPHCDKTLKLRGSLCGTNGRKYGNYCALQRYNCVAEQQISVEYFGKCRNSCKRVKCETGTHCLQDQNGVPHCVHCTELLDNPADYMCGENGKMYRNICELKADMCKTGQSIRISHSGKCLGNNSEMLQDISQELKSETNLTCKTLTCPRGATCLVSAVSGKPVCMSCHSPCIYTSNVTVCGTDRRTYSSYCTMLRSGCQSGVYVSALRKGHCRSCKKRRHLSKAKLKTRNRLKSLNRNAKIKARKQTQRRHRRNRRQHRKRKRQKHKTNNT